MNKMLDTNQNSVEVEADALLATKKRISQKYLGQAGIHAVGLQRTQNAISIYYNPKSDTDQNALFQMIRDETRPYTLLTIPESPAALQSSPSVSIRK